MHLLAHRLVLMPQRDRCIGTRHACRPLPVGRRTPLAPQAVACWPEPEEGRRRQMIAGAAAAALPILLFPEAASALVAEPANALSLPTWAIHVSSVTEWVGAMALMWRYADVAGEPTFRGLAWGMLPALTSAMAACTWHFFYNAPELTWIVTYQAFSTVVGNFTLWYAAWKIYESSAGAAVKRGGD